VRIVRKQQGSYYGIARGVFAPSDVFPELGQGTGWSWISVVPRTNFEMGMAMDQPDEARNLFRFANVPRRVD